jgi:hypothetical protein
MSSLTTEHLDLPHTDYPHIEKLGNCPARLKRVPRTRVAMIVMDYLAHGYSPDEMVRQYPYLHIAEVHAAMGYYFDNQDEIDAEIRAELVEAEKMEAEGHKSPFYLRMKAKGILK